MYDYLYALLAFLLFLVLVKLWNKLTCGWCYSRTIMTGKVVIVTGANCGIGYETAANLARRGAKVILACRDEVRAKKAIDDIVLKTGNNKVIYKHLELSSLKSIRDFVDDIKANEHRVDVLVNNAGAAGDGSKLTDDGVLMEMQVNYLGHFLLTILLVPLLKKSDNGRVVHVSSMGHLIGRKDYRKMTSVLSRRSHYHTFRLYCDTKLYNVLFSNELARRLKGTNVTSNSLHPGHIRTSIYRNVDCFTRNFMNFMLSTFFKSALEGAQTSIYLSVSDEVSEVTGKYFSDCKLNSASATANNSELALELWKFSEELVKLQPEERI